METFAEELRFRREEVGLSRNKLAEALGCTPQWVYKVETCEKPPSEAFAQDLDTYFSTNGLFHRQWRKIRKYRRSAMLLPGFPQYVELEAQATIIRAFTPQVVSGLLQTEDYMRALMSTSQSPHTLEERVAGRLERQAAAFDRPDPAKGWFVLDESALQRVIGGPEVMRKQLSKLCDLASSPNIQVRILPFGSVTYAGLDGMFVTLTLADGTEVAYHEGPGVNQLTQELATINEYHARFDLVMGEAYRRSESLKIITKMLENLG
ncbi:helix-turn-helix transcriptional regulator [Actinoallomurus liliacearum]